ncbi:class I SAM-dependent methyltransferase [Paraburkholderia sp. JHI869]|uniref:class I SAM-dependent methyltransferase n=1 Tax=Paraburkholderia sp. JHI869 TaxID=3112959 RepID=UPI00317BE71A
MWIPPIKRLSDQRDNLAMSVLSAHQEVYDLRIEQIGLKRELEALESLKQEMSQSLENAQNRVAELEQAQELHALREALGQKDRDIARFGEEMPWVPNGHFYSPIPPRHEIEAYCAEAFKSFPRTLPDIDLREEEQLKFIEVARKFYSDLPFQDDKVDGLRYQYVNQAFIYTDAIMLNAMIRHAQPRRVIEVGSGHSSCMLLDTNELWFDNKIECSFIEPYPELLHSLLKPGDLDRITIYPDRVQDVPLDIYSALEPNDILFIDSTHVSRVGSDVNHILFNVLPSIKPGVIIHFHDIIYPFEYFRFWLEEGRAWNEAYLLRAFLQNNHDYEIVMFNSFMEHFHKPYFAEHMPLCLRGFGGSIWLRKVR